jgi:hypothetical protein
MGIKKDPEPISGPGASWDADIKSPGGRPRGSIELFIPHKQQNQNQKNNKCHIAAA